MKSAALAIALVSALFVCDAVNATVVVEGQKVPDHGAKAETSAQTPATSDQIKKRPDLSFRDLEEHHKNGRPGWIVTENQAARYLRDLQFPKTDKERAAVLDTVVQRLRDSGRRNSVAFITVNDLQKYVATFAPGPMRLQALSLLVEYTDTGLPTAEFGNVDQVAQVFTPMPDVKVPSLRHQQHLAKEEARRTLDKRVADLKTYREQQLGKRADGKPRGIPIRQR